MLNVQLVGDRELIQKFDAMPSRLHDALLRKVRVLALQLERKVKVDKLSGQVLKVQTGNLRSSIQNTVIDSAQKIVGKVYSAGDVKYAGIHEFGGKTPPHVIEAKGKALAFMMGGKQVFAKRVNHPGSTMPERSFLRSSLADMRAEIVRGLQDAARQGVKLR